MSGQDVFEQVVASIYMIGYITVYDCCVMVCLNFGDEILLRGEEL